MKERSFLNRRLLEGVLSSVSLFHPKAGSQEASHLVISFIIYLDERRMKWKDAGGPSWALGFAGLCFQPSPNQL